VVVVDDHPLFRAGVSTALKVFGFEVVGEGGDAEEALALATGLLPDILLLDIAIPGGGLQAARAVAAACPATKTIMLTFSEAESDVLEALHAGARGYLLKGVSAPELAQWVRAIYRGEVYVTPSLAAAVLRDLAAPAAAPVAAPTALSSPLDELTERERQILELVASGRSNKEAGRELGLAEKTVKHHMSSIMHKLHVKNRVEAALLAHQFKR
jgi:two-component system, NarL family, nitrate/nitrite response regulator NarL